MYTHPYSPPVAEVRELELPAAARALTELARVDYTDAFLLETPLGRERSAEQWARATLEEAPASTRAVLRRGWFALGLPLGDPEDPRRILGWPVRSSSPDHAVLAADSLIGMEAEVLFKCEPDGLLVATILKLNTPPARAVWGLFSAQHRRVVRHLLEQVARRAAPEAA